MDQENKCRIVLGSQAESLWQARDCGWRNFKGTACPLNSVRSQQPGEPLRQGNVAWFRAKPLLDPLLLVTSHGFSTCNGHHIRLCLLKGTYPGTPIHAIYYSTLVHLDVESCCCLPATTLDSDFTGSAISDMTSELLDLSTPRRPAKQKSRSVHIGSSRQRGRVYSLCAPLN